MISTICVCVCVYYSGNSAEKTPGKVRRKKRSFVCIIFSQDAHRLRPPPTEAVMCLNGVVTST